MCGIIGYTGSENAIPKIKTGLSVLEYRGYDSVGLAARTKEEVRVVKCRGRVEALAERLEKAPIEDAHSAIGHTRWATHGGPSDTNAHPHRVMRVTLVHNGIIENDRELKAECEARGIVFRSETDTEVAAAVIALRYEDTHDPVSAIRAATERMRGSYAFAMLFDDRPGEVYAIRQGSPLLVAVGEDGAYLASDLTALLPFTKTYARLAEGALARLSEDGVVLLPSDGSEAHPPVWQTTEMTAESAQKGGYAHFMEKEIYEQPDAIRQGLSPRIQNGCPDFSGDGIDRAFWREVRAIRIVACGSAMHAGLLGAHLIESLAEIPTTVHIASEYRYHPPVSVDGTLVLLISQSGETADTLAALRYAKAKGQRTLAIVNAVETTIAREADHRIYTYAGPEIAVATTKGYCTQLSMLYLIAVAIAEANGRMDRATMGETLTRLSFDVPRAMEEMFSHRARFRSVAERLSTEEHVFFIGRGADFAMSEEGALKLKEISYIHAEAYAAGELKHGTISLIEAGTPVVAIATDPTLYDKMESNVREVRSRGAYVILLCRRDAYFGEDAADVVLRLSGDSDTEVLFSALAAVQLIAYETATLRGCDIDKPRNLAKSVTVE